MSVYSKDTEVVLSRSRSAEKQFKNDILGFWNDFKMTQVVTPYFRYGFVFSFEI